MNEVQVSFKANGTRKFTPDAAGKYLFTLGSAKGKNLGGGEIAIFQNKIRFPILCDDVIKPPRGMTLFLRAKKEVTLKLSGAKKPNFVINITTIK